MLKTHFGKRLKYCWTLFFKTVLNNVDNAIRKTFEILLGSAFKTDLDNVENTFWKTFGIQLDSVFKTCLNNVDNTFWKTSEILLDSAFNTCLNNFGKRLNEIPSSKINEDRMHGPALIRIFGHSLESCW